MPQHDGVHKLVAQLLCDTGMRILEALHLQMEDSDFNHGAIIVREALAAQPQSDAAM